MILQNVPGKNLHQNWEGISIRVKGIGLRRLYVFLLTCVQKMF